MEYSESLIISCLNTAISCTGCAVPRRRPRSGVNAGTLSCTVAGGGGLSKALNCVFSRPDGTAERYTDTVKKFGVDVGFTRESHIIWLVPAPGIVSPGALSGKICRWHWQRRGRPGIGANALIGGGSKRMTLQPVSIEGSVGLNVAAGLAGIELKKG